MSRNVSVDDQSDDGELLDSPPEPRDKHEQKTVVFILSEEEGEKVISSEVKPFRARSEKKDKERSGRTERNREERYSYREKHHRKKSGRVNKDKDQYQRERIYREKQYLEQANYDGTRERTDGPSRIRRHKTDRDKGEEKLTEEEITEQEQRRERLFQAERERAILKEQSRVERELRRDLKRAIKRKRKADIFMKRRKDEEIVTLSDSPDVKTVRVYHSKDQLSDHSPEIVANSRSVPNSDQTHPTIRSAANESPCSGRSSSHTGSASESPGLRGRSRSGSPGSMDEEKEMEVEDKDNDDDDDDEEPKLKLDDSLPPYFPAVQGCRSVEEFQCLNRIEEGTYGIVYRAKDKRTEDIVALKRLKMEREKEGFPITSLREINTLLKGQHPNMVTVREIVVGNNMDKIFIVMDYVEHDLKSLMETMRHKKQHFMPGEIKCLLKQLLLAVAHLHDNWILHRDLKTSNLLLSHKGILKVGDFGLAREYGSPLKAYTPGVVTAWYRAPELLLCAKEYSTPIDLWSVGCIFAELVLMNPLFPGKSEVDQLNRIFKDLGTPSEKIWPGFNQLPAVQKMKFNEYPVSNLRGKFNTLSEAGLGLLLKFLTYDPAQRTTAESAMTHAYFSEPPMAIDPAMFPTWPAKSEVGLTRALASSPRPPSGGGEYKKLSSDVDEDGFRIGTGVDKRREGPGFSLKF